MNWVEIAGCIAGAGCFFLIIASFIVHRDTLKLRRENDLMEFQREMEESRKRWREIEGKLLDLNKKILKKPRTVEKIEAASTVHKKMLVIAYSSGYECGHHDTVEGAYASPDVGAMEWVEEALQNEEEYFDRELDL